MFTDGGDLAGEVAVGTHGHLKSIAEFLSWYAYNDDPANISTLTFLLFERSIPIFLTVEPPSRQNEPPTPLAPIKPVYNDCHWLRHRLAIRCHPIKRTQNSSTISRNCYYSSLLLFVDALWQFSAITADYTVHSPPCVGLWWDYNRNSQYQNCEQTINMEVFSLIKSSLAPEDTNPIHRLYRVGHQVGACGQEMVWRIHDAESIEEEKVCDVFYFSLNISLSPKSLRISYFTVMS